MKYMLLLLIISGCSRNTKEVLNILQSEGCKGTIVDFTNVGCAFLTCGDDYIFGDRFSCIRNGVAVNGCVCSGAFKGYSVKYK